VNPRETEILGEKSFKSPLDVPEPIDIVNVFCTPGARIAEAAACLLSWIGVSKSNRLGM